MRKTGKWLAVSGIALAALLGLGFAYAQLNVARPMSHEDKCPMQRSEDKSGTYSMPNCNMTDGRVARGESRAGQKGNPAVQSAEPQGNGLAPKQAGQNPGKLGGCCGGTGMMSMGGGSHMQSSPMGHEPGENREKENTEGSSCH